MPGRLMSTRTTSGRAAGRAARADLGIGVLAQALESFGAIEEAGEGGAQLVVVFDDGYGGHENSEL